MIMRVLVRDDLTITQALESIGYAQFLCELNFGMSGSERSVLSVNKNDLEMAKRYGDSVAVTLQNGEESALAFKPVEESPFFFLTLKGN